MDLRKLLQMSGMGAPPTGQDTEVVDTSETIQISSLALLKMLKHGMPLFPLYTIFTHLIGRAGVPMEVMGLMLGTFIDDYTVFILLFLDILDISLRKELIIY
jgi:26S proteasome regulatory subunit N11